MIEYFKPQYIGITISYNYGDVLKYTIDKNINLFKKWYIITDETDQETIDIIKKLNKNNIIEIAFFNFRKEINRGKATSTVQRMVHLLYPNDWIILIEADTFFTKELEAFLKEQSISLEDFNNIKNSQPILAYTGRIIVKDINEYDYLIKLNKERSAQYQKGNPAAGYFQMYFHKNYYYPEEIEGWPSDLVFAKKFKYLDKLPYPVIHLGEINRWKKAKTYKGL